MTLLDPEKAGEHQGAGLCISGIHTSFFPFSFDLW